MVGQRYNNMSLIKAQGLNFYMFDPTNEPVK